MNYQQCAVEKSFETLKWSNDGVMFVPSAVWSGRGYWRSSDRWERIRMDPSARCSCRRWWKRNGAPYSRPITVSGMEAASEMCVLSTALHLALIFSTTSFSASPTPAFERSANSFKSCIHPLKHKWSFPLARFTIAFSQYLNYLVHKYFSSINK